MWPAAATLIYYLGIGSQAVWAVWLAQRLRVRSAVIVAICGCYLVGMTVGARLLFELRPESAASAPSQPSRHGLQGMWGGPLVYLALAVPTVLVMSRRTGTSAESKALSTEGGKKGPRGSGSGVQGSGGRVRSRQEPSHFSPLASPRADASPWASGLDLVALVAPIPMAIAKLACLCAGCCHGRPTDLPWAITFPAGLMTAPGGIALHPTQLYDFLALLAAGGLLLWLNRPRWRGTLLLWFLAAYGLGRLLTECTRLHPPGRTWWGPLTPFQWSCAATALICGGALVAHACRTHTQQPCDEGPRPAKR